MHMHKVKCPHDVHAHNTVYTREKVELVTRWESSLIAARHIDHIVALVRCPCRAEPRARCGTHERRKLRHSEAFVARGLPADGRRGYGLRPALFGRIDIV